MAISLKLVLFVIFVILVAVLVSYLLRKRGKAEFWLPLGIASASLVLSLVGVFKEEFFIFNPVASVGDVYIINKTKDSETIPSFLIPIQFLNKGYGEGIVEDLIFRVTKDKTVFFLAPSIELSWAEFIKNKGDTLFQAFKNSFVGFPLSSKQALSKSILFHKRGERYILETGTYFLELFMLTNLDRKPKMMLKFSIIIKEKDIKDFNSGNSIGIINRKIAEKDILP